MTTSSETLYHLLPFWKSARKCVFVTDHPKILSGIYPATSSDRSPFNKIFCRFCASFDFQPGSRIATFSGDPQYEESTCYMTAEQSKPEGLGTLILAPNSIHFTEVCITCTSFFAPNFFSLRVGFLQLIGQTGSVLTGDTSLRDTPENDSNYPPQILKK